MKTTRNYLEKTSQHLFKFQSQYDPNDYYFMKVIVNENTFNVLKFDKDLKLTSNKEYKISDWERTSPKGKIYVPTNLKNYVLFYRGWSSKYTSTSVKHFKAIREKIDQLTTEAKVAA